MKKRILIVLLSVILVLGLIGCQPTPEQPVETTEPVPQAGDVYAQARALLDSADAVTFDVVSKVTTTVENNTFTEEAQQILSFSGLQTESPVVSLSEEVIWAEPTEDETTVDEEKTYTYAEIYTDETLYVKLEDMAAFSGSLKQEDAAGRYIPVVLLDAALYEELTLEEGAEQDAVHFKSPTAAESWAVPEGAQLQEAFGSAKISKDGALQQMNYTVTYVYGSAQITLEVESTPQAEAEPVTAPEDADKYAPLQCVDALRLLICAENKTMQAQTANITSSNTILCQAAGFAQSTRINAHMYDAAEDLLFKSDTAVQIMDGSGNSETYDIEETYKDGKYVSITDGGLPTTQSGVKEEDMRQSCEAMIRPYVPMPEYWTEAVLTDLGSTYLVEYTYSEDYGNNNQNSICSTLFYDPSFLNNYATAYENKEVSGYLGIDKYTGLVTSSGMYYEGVHTIDGNEYILSMQIDQAVEAPSFGAYEAITDEMPQEEEPAQKPQPLFYHVTGADGQEMWLLGTIHVGDNRTAFLPQQILDAFTASDALALEFDSERFDEEAENDEELQQQIAAAYYYTDGTTVQDHLDAETYELALKFIKASGSHSDSITYFKVSLWESFISNFLLQQGHTLHSEQGVEERLTQWAKEQEKPIRDVESGLFQTQMLTGWSDELQSLLLEEILETDPVEYWTQTQELFELWCAGDEEALRAMLNEETDLSELTEEELAEYQAMLPLEEEYNKAMNFDRNEGMLEVAIEYLESDDVVFYAVGLAHLLDDTNGLVETLRQAGYTVELVSYSES